MAVAESPQRRVLVCSLLFSLYFFVGLLDGLIKPVLISSLLEYWLFDFLSKVLLPTLCLVLLCCLVKVRPSDYGLRAKSVGIRAADMVGLSFMCTVVLAIYFPIYGLARLVFPPHMDLTGYQWMLPAGEMRFLSVPYLAASAAFFEQVFFIGLLGYVLRQSIPRQIYPLIFVVAASLLAGLTHWEGGLANLIGATVVFAAASIMYLRIDSLWPLIVAHFIIDLIVFW